VAQKQNCLRNDDKVGSAMMTEDDIKNLFSRLVAIETALWRIECRQQGKDPELEQIRMNNEQNQLAPGLANVSPFASSLRLSGL
jgi:hypothetical protein